MKHLFVKYITMKDMVANMLKSDPNLGHGWMLLEMLELRATSITHTAKNQGLLWYRGDIGHNLG